MILLGHGHGANRTVKPRSRFGQSEVEHLRPIGFVNQHIARFQVAVNDAALVGVVHGSAQFRMHAHDLR